MEALNEVAQTTNLEASLGYILLVEMCHQNSVIRDIKLDQKGRDSRHNLKTKQKPCTKVLEIQKLATFDCFPP